MDREEARQALAERVRRRRLTLGWSIDDAAERGSMSPTTWTRVEEAKKVRDLTYAGIERALGWQQGSVDLIAEGGEAREVEGAQGTVRSSEESALKVARRLPPSVLQQLLAERTDPHLLRVMELWPRLSERQRRAMLTMLEDALSLGEPTDPGGKPEREDERRTG